MFAVFRVMTSAAALAGDVVGMVMLLPAATTGDFANFFQLAGRELRQCFTHGDGLGGKNTYAMLLQAIEHATPDAAAEYQSVNVGRNGTANAGSGVDPCHCAIVAIDNQQGWRSAQVGENFGFKAIQTFNR